MRLSEAIALGRTLIDFDLATWCTCAVGMAGAAIGKQENIHQFGLDGISVDFPILNKYLLFPAIAVSDHTPFTADLIGEYEPIWFIVSALAWRVKEESITLDQLIDWVRSVEPPEANCESPVQDE